MITPPSSSPHAERQYLHTMVAGALLPFAQSTITALVIAIALWVIAFFVFDMQDSYKVFIVSFALTWVIMFLRLQRHWLNLTTIEQFIQRDLNNDGVIGEAQTEAQQPARRRVTIDLSTISADKAYQSNAVQLPCDDEQLYLLAQGLTNGMPFSEKTWTGKGKPFSTQEFREVKAELFKHGLIEYISEADKRQGIQPTIKGKAFFSELVSSTT